MLILTRKIHERIVIGDDIEVSIVDIKGDQVKLGIRAPRHVKVYRQEVYEAVQRENRMAARRRSDELPSLDGLFGSTKASGSGTGGDGEAGDTGPTKEADRPGNEGPGNEGNQNSGTETEDDSDEAGPAGPSPK